ncbi:gamma-glutamyl phosphate reductase [Elstera cyanobacteriorum]|uniref:Gamma-glutamyl phosphate reductase n=1 Tax=Elstera cyanobacteriorum TaxID=2022747 RepID=A0A255XK07_9PROT|nr:glutamate-5-semialdehyde dehydrogenase [Elstera cyanobacteriorum]OYQ16620.1 glutamate-5-semialdehyde dehydrogenase [Elstera cyanobacteriorum]GFZ87291.1 gamma-glutamyl phosphate reductase [Elstera cyanobacteriorum]
MDQPDLATQMAELGARATAAAAVLAQTSGAQRAAAVSAMAAALRAAAPAILTANDADMARAADLSSALRDRLKLTPERLEGVAKGLDEIAALPDPLGTVLEEWQQPNGLQFQKVRVPLGVIGIIYESRPNVTADAGALCVKSGNAVILRGGSDSFASSGAILTALRAGLKQAGLPEDAVQAVPTPDRAAVGVLLTMTETLDVVIPRGGKSLIARVAAESRVPVLKHLDGNCHTYIHAAADLEKARKLVLNAKLRRTGVCGATESLLFDAETVPTLAAPVLKDLLDAGCEVRGDAALQALDARILPATEEDWGTEYLEAIVSAKVVHGVGEAVAHINRYGSHHTEAIVTEDAAAAETFLNGIDSAIVLHNASTQFADGGEFGFGAEIGISTGKLHVRGPVGAQHLTSIKYLVRGNGTVRAG